MLKNQLIFKLDQKKPVAFATASLFFIYFLQYPLSRLFIDNEPLHQYALLDWMFAYIFVISSVLIFLFGICLGMSGRSIPIESHIAHAKKKSRKISIVFVLLIFSIFGLWSYVMLKLNIGITIWTNFEPLPLQITGLLFYGRLLIQPIILCYIAHNYSNSSLKWIIFLLIVGLGVLVSLSSGSRFAAILFSAPLFFLFSGKIRYLALFLPLLVFVTIATVSRNFFLPTFIGDPELIAIYSNELYRAAVIENLWLLPLEYIVVRSMGISEVLMTISFGRTTPGFFDSLQVFLSSFLPFIQPGNTVSIKNIYGLTDDAFGGFGLDFFSNFFVLYGGEPILYAIGLCLIGWMLGKSYRMFSIGLARYGATEFNLLVFIIIFILLFEGRVHLMLPILLSAWIFSRKSTSRTTFTLIKAFVPPRHLRLVPLRKL